MSLATRLKSSRKKLGLSQAELARQVDVSQPTIANWERGGHIPRPDALQRIAKALDTDSAWLLSGEHPAATNPAHQHLAKPIHHIAVHEWPMGDTVPANGQPLRYMAVAADVSNVFALIANEESGFPSGSILVFSLSDRTLPGRFLVRSEKGYRLEDRPSFAENVAARLIYSVVSH
ncbi:MAG: helix-turn-helix transcriptional regulator [Litorimonas sp.]